MGRGRPKGYVVSQATKDKIAATRALRKLQDMVTKPEPRTVQSFLTMRATVVERPKVSPDKKWGTKLYNKGIERCPNCEFPEAYGGFCPECGWTAPIMAKDLHSDMRRWVQLSPTRWGWA